TAKKKITLNAGGSYITLDQSSIESGTQGDYLIKSAHFDFLAPAQQILDMPQLPQFTEHRSKANGPADFSG
ncbi:DUF2345 domain-containing protein, partial [Pseudomonas sp. 2822-17]|uniref:DUF2345 domain-containing protein n=2 Tax=Pseudomonas TaxID=286 RepID=UPI000C43A3DD